MSSPTPDTHTEKHRSISSLSDLVERVRGVIGQREVALMIFVAVMAGGVWSFITLADEVGEGETEYIDERILHLFRTGDDLSDPIGSHSVESAVRDVTALGSLTVIAFLTFGVGIYFFLSRQPRMGLFIVGAVTGGALMTYGLKFLYDRARPDFLPTDSIPGDPSFPSGHAAVSAVAYLTLALLLARSVPRREQKVYIVGMGVLLTLAVGISRVYLGVHWPTDVLAGWTLGGVWALVCWQVERTLQRHGVIERSVFVKRTRQPAASGDATVQTPSEQD